MATGWTPLLVGNEADKYLAIVDDIVLDYERDRRMMAMRTDWGLALLHAYRGAAGLGPGDFADRARACASAAADRLEQLVFGPALYSGIAGIGWLCAHIDRVCPGDAQFDLDEIDAFLFDFLRPGLRGIYDLISGPVGLGVYFLERQDSSVVARGVSEVQKCLSQLARGESSSHAWLTAPALLPSWQRRLAPGGYYNLGVAHGVPGVIGWLAEAVMRTDAADRALLRKAASWVTSHRLAGGSYPGWVAPGVEATPGRLAWCYGPLGLSLTLLAAARALGDLALGAEALATARAAARNPGDDVMDASLCHGAAGNAHMFNRLYQATGRPEFAAAARRWLGETLQRRGHGGAAGFRAYKPDIELLEDPMPYKDDRSFLTGSAGIGLVLLAATTTVEPQWDRVLLTRLSWEA